MLQNTYNTKALSIVNQALALDVEGLATAVFALVGTFVGTVTFEYSVDNVNWQTLTVTVVGGTAQVTTATAPGQWTANVAGFKSVRIRCSAYTSGTIIAQLRAILSGGGSGSGGGGNGTYNVTPPTLSDGQTAPAQVDANGNQKVTLATLLAGEDLTNNVLKVEERFSPASITTQTTTNIKSGAGFLHNILIPTPVASATIKIYDNTAASGTVLVDTITFPATLVSDGPIQLILNKSFATGLTVVTAGATMAVDVSYR